MIGSLLVRTTPLRLSSHMWEWKEPKEMAARNSLPTVSNPPETKRNRKTQRARRNWKEGADTIVQRQGAQAEQLIQVPPLYQHSCATAFF